MSRIGITFDYKVGNRHAWLYFAGVILFGSVILVISFHTYTYFLIKFTIFDIIEYVGTGLHQNQMMAAPFLTYVYLLRNLQKRFAALNQLLK